MSKLDDVKSILALAQSKVAIDWETSSNWAEWVTKPVIDYPLAPRQARAILEVFGYLSSLGFDVLEIAEKVLGKVDTSKEASIRYVNKIW